MPNNCKVRVVFRNGRYALQLDPKMRPSACSLKTLLVRGLSAVAPFVIRDIGVDTWHALGGVERATAVLAVLARTQAAAKRMTLLADTHQRVLDLQTWLLVLLARTPSFTAIHYAAPYRLHKDDEQEIRLHKDEEEGEIDGEDFDEADEADATGRRVDNRVHNVFNTWWWDHYAFAEKCTSWFAQHYGRSHRLHHIMERLVLWNPARPTPLAFLHRLMPNGAEDFSSQRVADTLVLLHLQNAGLVLTKDFRVLYLHVPDWVRYYYQRKMRGAGRLRSVFASILRILKGKNLPPSEAPAEEA